MTTTAAQESNRSSVRRVLANGNLRRVQLAFFASVIGDWAQATALTVWAYTDGGAAAVGAFTAARFIAVALAGPLGSVIADKVPRRTFMIATDTIRAVLVSLGALVIMTDGPSLLVYVLGIVVSVVGAPFRSAQVGLIPQLVDRPDELTASNAVASNLENVAVFLGPALGALLVARFDITTAIWVNVASYLWSILLVSGVRPRRLSLDVPDPDAENPGGASEPSDANGAGEPGATTGKGGRGFFGELSAGFTFVGRDRDLRTVALLAAAQGFVWGTLTVFTVIIAVDLLRTGPAGVGVLDAVMGGATTLGGLIVLTRVSKGKLGQDMATGVLGWSLPMVALALFPSPVTVFGALFVIGLADPWVNLGLETIPQRLASDAVISRVYGAVESALIAAMALGAAVAPLLIHGIGFRPAMGAVGVLVAGLTLTTLRTVRRLDARLTEPEHLSLLRSLEIFAPLAPPTLEALAHKLVAVSVASGDVVVREGETSDRFYVIASGSVEVSVQGRVLRVESAGDFFGEIGLIRDVPRTATVTAVQPSELLALDRDDFLEAVSGIGEASRAAEEIVTRRLAV
jgi:predicted MFS family arabinose efflux permease